MQRHFALTLSILFTALATAPLRAEFVRGEINGWTNVNFMVLDTSFGNIYQTTITAFTNDSSAEFKFDRYGTWTGENWGATAGYTSAVKNLTTGNARYTNSGSPNNLVVTNQASGSRYSFRLAGAGTDWFRDYVVMETAADPVTILAVNSAVNQSTGAVPTTLQLSATTSATESIWVRFSTNSGFAPSLLIPSTGSGTNFNANLPAQAAGTRAYYYVLTSTMPSNVITGNYDLCTLRGKISGATNYSFRYGAMEAFHVPGLAEPPGAYMRNPPTNGVTPSTAIYFYSGVQTGGTGNAANQSGLALVHRLKGSSAWTTNAGGYDSNGSTPNNAYWTSSIPGNVYAATNEVEYYLRVTATDHNTTYLGTTNAGAGYVRFLNEVQVQAAPFSFTYGGPAVNLGNCWHLPGNSEPPGTTMRNPINDPQTNQAVYFYTGNQALGGGNAGDQSGGRLVYRLAPAGAWQTNALVFDVESGNNKYWRGTVPAGAFSTTNEIQYYLVVTYTDHDTTYLGTTDDLVSTAYAGEASAQANPFTYIYSAQQGQSAAYLWHADNRVVTGGSNVQFWVKIGYAQGTGSNRYVDFSTVYYTTDGSAPGGAKGVATNAGTQVAVMQFDHMEEDSYEGGDAMWWVGTATNLPSFTTIRYKIGAYKDTNSLERFADYGTSGTNNAIFSFALGTTGTQVLAVNGQNADYTATKFFIDEIAGDTQTVVVIYTPGVANVTNAEVFSNLGRRDLADVDYTNALIAGDGYPDGIKPPEGNLLTVADTGAYFRAWTMSGSGTFGWTGKVSKTGAYRLTARFQTNGSPTWTWYSSGGRRDHAVVVSPTKALSMTLYELNTLTVEATAANEAGRSTFRDLLSVADPAGDDDAFDPFNLEYLNYIQANALWFQPIHPVGNDRAENDPNTSSPYAPGSPYASRNYWAVTPKMGAGNSESSALSEFSNFVARCDTYTGSVGRINVMLDGVFNHSSWDAVMGQGGVDLGFTADPNARIGTTRPGWYANLTDYGSPGTTYASAWDNDFATAPDRGDFGKWNDVTEFYFGKYSALVRHNPDNNGDYLNEDDVFDFAGMSTNTMDLWKYFAYYPEYWLKKTGYSGTNHWVAAQDELGIDALRCDFGQGLPPQMWEYIINRTRAKKWNFVFMAETLDGGKPGYRSNRHFDLLNESMVFQFTQAKINDSAQLASAFQSRNTTYNGGAILLNLTSHDEVMPDNDPWITASRYAAVSMLPGLPMVFYGQEKGIGLFNAGDPNAALDGFADHELNFGKYVPHFKRWNQLQVWTNTPPFSTGLDQWYGRVNWARLNSPALRSPNNYILNTTGGGSDSRIFAVAKWERNGAGPDSNDVVLAFSRFMEHGGGHTLAANTYSLQGAWSQLGLDTGKLYTVRNLASSDAFALFTNGWPKTGADLYNNGIYVSLPADTSGPIAGDGTIVQYLKLVTVAASTNAAPVISLPGPHILALGSSTSFPVTVSDANGNAVTTNFVSGPASATFTGGQFSWTASPTNFVNTTNLIVFASDDQQGTTNSVVTNSTTIVVPFDFDSDGLGDDWEIGWFATLTNGPAGDNDGDGMPNGNEYVAGTGPLNTGSFFRVQAVVQSGGNTNRLLTVPTVNGRRYQAWFANSSYSNQAAWTSFGNTNDGFGTWLETNPAGGTRTFVDDETTNSTFGPPGGGQRTYRVTVERP